MDAWPPAGLFLRLNLEKSERLLRALRVGPVEFDQAVLQRSLPFVQNLERALERNLVALDAVHAGRPIDVIRSIGQDLQLSGRPAHSFPLANDTRVAFYCWGDCRDLLPFPPRFSRR